MTAVVRTVVVRIVQIIVAMNDMWMTAQQIQQTEGKNENYT